MKNKTNIYLFGILSVLLVIATSPYWKPILDEKLPKNTQEEIDLSIFTKEKTKEIRMKDQNAELTLTNKGESWLVSDKAADIAKIDDVFASLSSQSTEGMVSKNPDQLSEYGLGDEGVSLVLVSESLTKLVIIGKEGPHSDSYYAKSTDSPKIYLVSGNFARLISTNILNWRDKTVFSVDADEISIVTLTGKNASTIKKLDSGSWQMMTGGRSKTLTAEQISSVFSYLSPLTATDILTDQESIQKFRQAPKSSIQFAQGNGRQVVAVDYSQEESDIWIQKSGGEEVFVVPDFKLKPLFDPTATSSAQNT